MAALDGQVAARFAELVPHVDVVVAVVGERAQLLVVATRYQLEHIVIDSGLGMHLVELHAVFAQVESRLLFV